MYNGHYWFFFLVFYFSFMGAADGEPQLMRRAGRLNSTPAGATLGPAAARYTDATAAEMRRPAA